MIRLFFCLFSLSLFAAQVDTFYGPLEVEEPVVLELIESPIFQRLKKIHQYGVASYTTHREEYYRYDHSIGVFAILREKGASLKEQIAGLLHDVSHTVFSHVGDRLFAGQYQTDDYQTSIHQTFLEQTGLDAILKKHGFTAAEVLPKEEYFPALEQKAPALCADRIDYNLQGAFYQHFLTHDEAKELLKDLQFINGRWVGTNCALLAKLTRFSLFMTQDCWGSPTEYMASGYLVEALLRALDLHLITKKDIQFGTDQQIWDLLLYSKDPLICEKMQEILHVKEHCCLVDPSQCDLVVKRKFRGIDPWIQCEGSLVHLTDIDSALGKEYQEVKELMQRGWGIKLQQIAFLESEKSHSN